MTLLWRRRCLGGWLLLAQLAHGNDIVRLGYNAEPFEPFISYHNSSSGPPFTGLLPEFVGRVFELTQGVSHEIVPLANPPGQSVVLNLLSALASGAIDAVILDSSADVFHTLLASQNSTRGARWSVPILSSSLTGLVKRTTKRHSEWWAFLLPFTPRLWGIVFAFFSFLSCLMLVNELIAGKFHWYEFLAHQARLKANHDKLGRRFGDFVVFTLRLLGLWLTHVYHSLAALMGGDDFPWTSGPARLFRLGLLVFVFVINATYTAELASFFTREQVRLGGPKSSAELKVTIACSESAVNAARLRPHFQSVVYPETAAYPLIEQRMDYCRQALASDEAGIWIADRYRLKHYLISGRHCNEMSPAPSSIEVQFKTFSMVLSAAMAEKHLAKLDTNIAYVKNTQFFISLLAQYTLSDLECSTFEDITSDDDAVDVRGMYGLFLVTGLICFTATATASMEFWRTKATKRQEVQVAAPESSSRNTRSQISSVPPSRM